jgi:hypothetical protein
MLTDPPFMPQKGQPAFHLRDTTPAELEQFQRMLAKAEADKREAANFNSQKETHE